MKLMKVDSRGRVCLGKEFANKTVEVKVLPNNTVVITIIKKPAKT